MSEKRFAITDLIAPLLVALSIVVAFRPEFFGDIKTTILGSVQPSSSMSKAELAAIFEAFANELEYTDRLANTADLADSFVRFGKYTSRGQSARRDFPQVMDRLGTQLSQLDADAPAGEAAELTPELKSKAINIFRKEAEALR